MAGKRNIGLIWIVSVLALIFFVSEFGFLSIVGFAEPPSRPYDKGWTVIDKNPGDNIPMIYSTDVRFPENGFGFEQCFDLTSINIAGINGSTASGTNFNSICGSGSSLDKLVPVKSTLSGKLTIAPGLVSDGSAPEPTIWGHFATPGLPAARGTRIISENLYGLDTAFDIQGADATTGTVPPVSFFLHIVEENFPCATDIAVFPEVNSIKIIRDPDEPSIYSFRVNNQERCRFIPANQQIHLAAEMASPVGGPNERLALLKPRIYTEEVTEVVVTETHPITPQMIEELGEEIIPDQDTISQGGILLKPKGNFAEKVRKFILFGLIGIITLTTIMLVIRRRR